LGVGLDTEITGLAFARLCHEFAKLPAAGVVRARLLNRDGTFQTRCVQSFLTIINRQVAGAAIKYNVCVALQTKQLEIRLCRR